MPYIKVNVDALNEYQQDVYDICRRVGTISNSFSNISYELDSDVTSRNGIGSTMQNVESALWAHETVLYRANMFLANAASKYVNVEGKDHTNEPAIANEGDAVVQGAVLTNSEKIACVGGIGLAAYSIAAEIDVAAIAAAELGISESEIRGLIDKGLCTLDDIVEFIEGKASECNKFVQAVNKSVKFLTGSSRVIFTMKNGYVVVSKFTRNSLFNKLVQKFHKGTGIGPRYTVKGLQETPVIGKVYEVSQLADKVDKIANVVAAATAGASDLIETASKLNKIRGNDQLSDKEKKAEASAVLITSSIGMALDVGAPFAGTAVQKIVTTAMSTFLPGAGTVVGAAVGWAAGQIVEGGMKFAADVITSDAVVEQVSTAIENIGDAASAGKAAISEASKKVKESENFGEAVKNTAELVGTAVSAGVEVVSATVTGAIDTVSTFVNEAGNKLKEGAKNIGKGLVNAGKNVINCIKKW